MIRCAPRQLGLAASLVIAIAAAWVLMHHTAQAADVANTHESRVLFQDEATSDENDDLVPVALGTAGVAAAGGLAAGVGYLYRRRSGMAARYDDGFTPSDPRDRPVH
ncbi:MAG TPA: hypothetical protein VNL92_07735 [Dehalococcoidia bacterium]|nr:hypothetical protein [Dehalococcoidia bacterium]